jgi:alpha-glucuronidase
MDYSQAWLNYRKTEEHYDIMRMIIYSGKSIQLLTAVRELAAAFETMTGQRPETAKAVKNKTPDGPCIFLKEEADGGEGYLMGLRGGILTISGGASGVLYGAFALIRKLACADRDLNEAKTPSQPIRMLNHWDNMDGTIERGYSGFSFFFKGDGVLVNDRTREYARLLASCGINGAAINNVNVKGAATRLITAGYFDSLRKLAEIFEEYGIRLYLSLNFAAPIELGGLLTADPLDETVIRWWDERMSEVFREIPNLGGFVVKADSEGRPGPFTYNRTHTDGANMLAAAVRPYGGLIIWRCFVYNCRQDWRDTKTDRARAAFDNFAPLDGSFADNVYLQIKNGPVDFQVREPVSPLFGRLKNTRCMLEVQIAQEYTGQQRHVCYLLPMFKEILSFKTYNGNDKDTVGEIIGGIAAVSNTGDDYNWTGHDLAAANLYGYGRLAYDMSLSAEDIAREWIALTYGTDGKVTENILNILMKSWPAYEKYSAPLGIGWMCEPGYHYGPNPDGYEYDRWGTYHKADHLAVGVDRTPSGTGFSEQYNPPLNKIYADKDSCPEELLLFFHRLPYTYRLKSGKTLIQHIYDTHFEGYEDAERFIALWKELEGLIEPDSYSRVLDRLNMQLEHAREWRDVINSYFWRKTLIPDEKGRTLY